MTAGASMLRHKTERLNRSLAALDLTRIEPWHRSRIRRPATQLSPRQELAALELAMEEFSLSEIGQRWKVGRTQLWTWRRNPEFAALVRVRRAEFYALLWRHLGIAP
jgi:hypothetical protein